MWRRREGHTPPADGRSSFGASDLGTGVVIVQLVLLRGQGPNLIFEVSALFGTQHMTEINLDRLAESQKGNYYYGILNAVYPHDNTPT